MIDARGAAAPDLAEQAGQLIDRELSMLDFQSRVLALAADEGTPLLERAKFLAIFSSNLDEFFQVRVAGIKSRQAAGLGAGPGTGTPSQQLQAIGARVAELVREQSEVFLKGVAPELADAGIRLSTWEDLDDDDRHYLEEVYERQIHPILTPLAVDPGHPFPYISDLSLNLAVIVRSPSGDERRFARVKVPPLLDRFIVMPDGERFVPLEQVIGAHLGSLFPGMDVEYQTAFRVTRNMDLTPQEDEEADDLLAAVEMELRRRRFGDAVRLEVAADATDEVVDLLLPELGLMPQDVYRIEGPLDLSGLWAVYGLDRPDLKDCTWTAVTPPAFERGDGEPADLFAAIADSDLLVHHPYESFSTTVEEFIRQAAADRRVMAIKISLYRTSGDSPIVKALIRAAERGKQVAALVELKARFDEQANIAWARALEEAGVHVVYGLMGLKTHCKTALVVRQDDDGIRRYCHIGTGNYNPATARTYEDMGLLTCDPGLGADLTDLFNFLTGYSRQAAYRKILVAPLTLRRRLTDLIREQAALGPEGRIVAKCNSVVDPHMIGELLAASAAGVPIDLVVRGMCSLRPGLPGTSDTIRVRSVLGRYLEHSRIYAFGRPETGGTRYFIGSADLMERNLDHRVEVITPVESPALQSRLADVLDTLLADDVASWELRPDGAWSRRHAGGADAQSRLAAMAAARARPLEGIDR